MAKTKLKPMTKRDKQYTSRLERELAELRSLAETLPGVPAELVGLASRATGGAEIAADLRRLTADNKRLAGERDDAQHKLRVLVEAATESLKFGAHDGVCDNLTDTSQSCSLHLKRMDERTIALKAALTHAKPAPALVAPVMPETEAAA